LATVIPDLEVHVPRSFILATSVFDDFMVSNALMEPALNSTDDDAVGALFQSAELPSTVTSALKSFLQITDGPVAVRSSSLFEDAFMQPFAGIYTSRMLPNDPALSLDERLAQLEWAVKAVYASTYTEEAKSYAESMHNRTEEEKMAVILQPLVGSADPEGRYFYPALAGVANSLDFYPLPHTQHSHGCAQVALGLGGSVVDGNPSVHFSLGDPSRLTGPNPSTLPVTALDLTASPATDSDTIVTLLNATDAALTTLPRATDMELAPEAARTVPLTQDVHGETVVFKSSYGTVVEGAEGSAGGGAPADPSPTTLAKILVGEVPLAKALSFLCRIGTAGLGCPVELEFALKLRQRPSERHQLHVLQIRPQAQVAARMSDRFNFLPSAEYAAVASTRALGHGRFEGITDVVYVSPDKFDADKTDAIASEIAAVNTVIAQEGRKYLLMGPGRWGSNDAQTGIPVGWKDIDNSAVIVETQLGPLVPVSQGSHFFQNIISFGLGYMTVDPSDASGPQTAEVADYAFFDSQPEVKHSTRFVRHVRLETPLEIVVDGQSRHGVVMKAGKPFDVYVSQVDAFMALAQGQNSATA